MKESLGFLSGIPKLEQVPSVNRQSGGDEAKRIGLVGRLHLSICGRVGGRGRICIKHLYCCPSQPFCCGACSADLPVIASLELFLKERHTSNSKTGMGDLDTPNSKTGVGEIPKDSNCNWKVTTGGGLSQEVGKSDLVPEKKGGSVGGGAPRCWVTKGSRLPLASGVRLATHDMRQSD